MFSKLFAVCFIAAVGATNIAANIPPGVYNIVNVRSDTLVRTYNPASPLFVSSTREFPGHFAMFEIRNSETSNGYTIKNFALNKYVSAARELPGEPIFANGVQEAFSIEAAGGGEFVIKAVNRDLLWTIAEPVIPTGNVILFPATGALTQHFIITPAFPDAVQETVPSSAKFQAMEPGVENCEHNWNVFRPIEVILQHFPYGRR